MAEWWQVNTYLCHDLETSKRSAKLAVCLSRNRSTDMLDVPPLLDEETAQFMQRGVSINVASGTGDGFPSVGRALGCRVSPDRRKVVIFFSAGCSASLLADLHNNGAIAAVFSMPTTHQTIQLKGRNVRFEPLREGDHAIIAGYRQAFIAEIVAMGQREALAGAIVPENRSDVVALSFTPTAAYVQTPGPAAGQPWQGRAWQ